MFVISSYCSLIEEGISILQRVLPSIKLPKTISESVKNSYTDIDTLVYIQKTDLKERINAKKNIISILTLKTETVKELPKAPGYLAVKAP